MLSMKQKEKIDRSFDGSTRLVDQWERELRRAAAESKKRTEQRDPRRMPAQVL